MKGVTSEKLSWSWPDGGSRAYPGHGTSLATTKDA